LRHRSAGFNRNLSAAEIVGQVWLAQRELAESSGDDVGEGRRRITNIVFMAWVSRSPITAMSAAMRISSTIWVTIYRGAG